MMVVTGDSLLCSAIMAEEDDNLEQDSLEVGFTLHVAYQQVMWALITTVYLLIFVKNICSGLKKPKIHGNRRGRE